MNARYWLEPEPPTWARRPLAWIACLTNALPITVVLVVLGEWLLGPPPLLAQVGAYGVVFALWAWTSRPWAVRVGSSR